MHPTNLAAPLADWPIVILLPVEWGNHDALRHVNNIIYFRWCESARIEYLEELGLWGMIEKDRVGPILAAIGCNYRRPVTYPDQIQVGARITRLGRTSFTMEHLIYSEAQQEVVADASSTAVVFDYRSQSPIPIPDAMRRKIEQMEGKSLSSDVTRAP
ncbi:MAG: thioesterase [Planctomycetia bacterium 21-64-5]|nr:MAG: thioesterase [Planctomycetia bacterium 21-64-5]HQU42392.1 thioesterase family protein [Pirellulales bacterium]